jgi:hypothetical protein
MPSSTVAPSKYLLGTRVDGQWGGAVVDSATLTALRAAGQFPDMWHFRGGRAAAVQSMTDSYVLSTRAGDAGSDVWVDQAPDADGRLAWMYDKAVTGFSAVSRDQFYDDLENTLPALIIAGPGKNAVPFDPAVSFQQGAILPRRVLVPVEAFADVVPPKTVGSRTDVKTYSHWKDGVWTVIFERDRRTAQVDDHDLNPDLSMYSFAFSVHDDHAAGRWHFVSFPLTLGGTGSGAAIQARFNP